MRSAVLRHHLVANLPFIGRIVGLVGCKIPGRRLRAGRNVGASEHEGADLDSARGLAPEGIQRLSEESYARATEMPNGRLWFLTLKSTSAPRPRVMGSAAFP